MSDRIVPSKHCLVLSYSSVGFIFTLLRLFKLYYNIYNVSSGCIALWKEKKSFSTLIGSEKQMGKYYMEKL